MYKKMIERGKKSFYKLKELSKKTLICLLALFMFIASSSLEVFANPKVKSAITPTMASTVSIDESSTGVTKVGDKYILENGASLNVRVDVNTQNLGGRNNDDTLTGVYALVKLGYFDQQNAVVDEYEGFGGIEARVTENNDYWQDTEFVDSQGDVDEPDLTDPNKVYSGELRLDFDPVSVFRGDAQYSYNIAISFKSDTQENATITIKTYAGYEEWLVYNGSGFDEQNVGGYRSDDMQESMFTIVNSNLKWVTEEKIITGKHPDVTAPTLWHQYNYQDILLTIKNVSEKKAPYFDSFEYVFKLQEENELNGVINSQLTSWLYDPNDPSNPIPNDGTGTGGKMYVGKYNQGGMLIYDVTNVSYSSDDYKNLYDSTQIGNPLPYVYNMQGVGSIVVKEEQGGTLHSPEAVQEDPTKKSEMTLLIRVPFPNNFTFSQGSQYVSVNNTYTPTVFFGSPQVAASKDAINVLQYFKQSKAEAEIKKVAQSDKMFVGKKGYYSISNIVNKSNLPLFNPTVIDTLPKDFSLTDLEYRVKSTEVSNLSSLDIKDILDDSVPFEVELENTTTNTKRYVSIGNLVEDTSGNTAQERVWKMENVDDIIENVNSTGTEEFTGKIKINYAYNFKDFLSLDSKLDINEAIPGELRVYGTPEKVVTVTNNVELYLDYYRYIQASEAEKEKWIGTTIEPPYSAQASKAVEAVEPWILTQGLFDDGTVRNEGNPTDGTMNSKANGYTVRFGNGNDSAMRPGRVTMKVPHGTTFPSLYSGLEIDNFKITADLLDKIILNKIVLTLYGGTTIDLDATQVDNLKDSDGNVKLSYSDWNANASFVNNLVQVEIYFDELKGNTSHSIKPSDDLAYIEYFGTYKYPGRIEMESIIETLYDDGVQAEKSKSDKGQLDFAMPTLYIETNSLYDDGSNNLMESSTIIDGKLNKPYSGFRTRMYVEKTALAPGIAEIQLPVDSKNVSTFTTHQIRITKDYLDNIKDSNGNSKYSKIELTGTDGAKITLLPSTLDDLIDKAGSKDMIIPDTIWLNDSAWGQNEALKNIKFYFEEYKVNTQSINFSSAFIEVLGKPIRNGNLEATGKISTDYSVGTGISQIVKNDKAVVRVLEPTLTTKTDGIYDNGVDPLLQSPLVKGTLNKDFSGYRVKINSLNAALDPGNIQLMVPATFTSNRIVISKDLLGKLIDDNGNASYTKLIIRGGNGTIIEFSKEDLDKFIVINDQTIVIKESDWMSQPNWGNAEIIQSITLSFSYYQEDLNSIMSETSYLEVRGMPTQINDSIATGKVSTEYPANSGNAQISRSANGTVRVAQPQLKIITQGFYDSSNGRTEANSVQAILYENKVGYIYRIGSNSETRIEPGHLVMNLPGSTTETTFEATQIKITKEMLEEMKMTGVEIISFDGVKTILSLSDLGLIWNPTVGSEYMTYTDDLIIPSSQWTGVAKQIIIRFDYYQEYTNPVATDDAYAEILGIANKEGTLTSSATVTTVYSSIVPISASSSGSLIIEAVRPTINALAHNENLKTNVDEQHAQTIKVPVDWDTYYTFDLGNDAKYTTITDSVVTLSMNNRVRKPSTEIHGFDVNRIVIPKDYKTKFTNQLGSGIGKITVVDTRKQADGSNITFDMDMTQALEDPVTGDLYFDKSIWGNNIEYPEKFVIELKGFLNDLKGNDCLRISLYGRTDWYTYTPNDDPVYKHDQSKWEKLSTLGSFETVNTLNNKKVTSDAFQDVPIPKVALSVEYENYYEHSQGSENSINGSLASRDAVGYVDGYRNYIAMPYERTLTKRFSLYQPSISASDKFTARIDLPINSASVQSEKSRGFHSEFLKVKNDIYDGTYFDDFALLLFDTNDMNRIVTLTYKGIDEGVVTFDVVESDGTQSQLTLDEGDDLILERKYWEEKGIESLGRVEITGDSFDTHSKNSLGDIFITGFSDSNFADGSYSGGHNDFTKTDGDAYLRNLDTQDLQTKEYPYTVRQIDEGRLLVSKMYFDMQVETGFISEKVANNNPNQRYLQTGISSEHVRVSDYSGESITYHHYDYDNREIPYKSLASIGVDFRQYLYDYQNQSSLKMPNNAANGHSASVGGDYARDMPDAETPRDFNSSRRQYLKKYAYNTKATIEMSLKLPESQGFESYYLKIDPRAVIGKEGQQFIQNIKVIRKDGSSQIIKGSELQKNAVKWNNTDVSNKDWYRVNLLADDLSQLFVTETNYKKVTETNAYYRKPSESIGINPVKEIIITVDMNQEESFDQTTAALPDFGNWVEDTTDMADQHMFEVVGRATKTGSLQPTATTKMTVGDREINSNGDTNPQRVEDGRLIGTNRSNWSLRNYYRRYYRTWHGYPYNYYTWHYSLEEYTAAHLLSSSTLTVTERSSLDNAHGIENDLYHRKKYYNYSSTTGWYVTEDPEYHSTSQMNSKDNYIYGRERPYNITWFRRANPGSYGNAGGAYDTTSQESHIDHAYLTDTLPPLSGKYTAADGYEGFKPNSILIKTDLLDHAKTLTVKAGNTATYTYEVEDFINAGTETKVENNITYYVVNIYYDDDPAQITDIQNKKDTDIVIVNNEYLTSMQVYASDIAGDNDFASETHGQSRDTYFENKNATSLIRLYGNVNVIKNQEKNGTFDGINRVNSYIRNDGGNINGTGSWYAYRPALMKAFQIPLRASSTLTYKGKGNLWDYNIDQNSFGTNIAVNPMVAKYALNFANTGRKNQTAPGDTTKYDESNISKISFTQPLDDKYRMTKISVPEELFKGTKFKMSQLSVNVGGANIDVLDDFVLEGNEYVLDLTNLFKTGKLSRTNTTSGSVVYASEKIASFTGTYEVLETDPANVNGYLQADEELLDNFDDLTFEGVWVDRTQSAIDADEWDESENNTPTVGKNPDVYSGAVNFGARTSLDRKSVV